MKRAAIVLLALMLAGCSWKDMPCGAYLNVTHPMWLTVLVGHRVSGKPFPTMWSSVFLPHWVTDHLPQSPEWFVNVPNVIHLDLCGDRT